MKIKIKIKMKINVRMGRIGRMERID